MFLIMCVALGGCGSSGERSETVQNDSQRQADQLAKQAEALTRQAEDNTATIERALENESAIVFENRGNLLNETATNTAADGNRSR